MNRSAPRAHAALIIAMMLWGSAFGALKIAIDEAPPLLVVFGRMFIATLVFACILIFAGAYLGGEKTAS